MPASPRPDEGAVSWNINTACNFRCSYCTQRFKEDRGRWSRDTPRFIAAFARLPGRWEVKISGGEPFVHPTLPEIVEGLATVGHRISIVTNFSASEEALLGFVRAARGRVGIFSCSLHLEYVDDVAAFAAKAQVVTRALQAAADPLLPAPSLNVTCVATRANLGAVDAIAGTLRDAGLVFKLQPEKQEGAIIDYAPGEEQVLLRLGGHNLTGRIAHRYAGRPCWSGARYFVLDDVGEAYRCYPARRGKLERMGNFLDAGFRLAEQPMPCLYNLCTCTVPIARGMMPKESS